MVVVVYTITMAVGAAGERFSGQPNPYITALGVRVFMLIRSEVRPRSGNQGQNNVLSRRPVNPPHFHWCQDADGTDVHGRHRIQVAFLTQQLNTYTSSRPGAIIESK